MPQVSASFLYCVELSLKSSTHGTLLCRKSLIKTFVNVRVESPIIVSDKFRLAS